MVKFGYMVFEPPKGFVAYAFVQSGQDRVIVQWWFVGVDAVIIAGDVKQLCAGDRGILTKAYFYSEIMHSLSGLFDLIHTLAG